MYGDIGSHTYEIMVRATIRSEETKTHKYVWSHGKSVVGNIG
jgi:hypothetical protein